MSLSSRDSLARLDPFGVADYAVLGIGSVVIVCNFLAYACVFANRRHYLPFRTKNTEFMGIAMVASALWWYGSIFSQGGVAAVQSRPVCILVNVWLRWALGGLALLCILQFRLLILYQIFICKRPPGGIWFYTIPFLTYIPGLIIGIPATILPAFVNTTTFATGETYCVVHTPYVAVYWVYSAMLVLFLFGLAFAIRHIKASFNEFHEMLWALIPTAIALFYSSGLGVSDYQYTQWARLSTALLTLIAASSFFWAVYWRPLYGYWFNRDQYLNEFNKSLAVDGFSTLNGSTCNRSNHTMITTVSEKPSNVPSASQLPDPDYELFAQIAHLNRTPLDMGLPTFPNPRHERHLV
ncbi:hypothetical protein H4R35_003136 [Dimargaris xerosporica]|nr:hypothetical protein H4R35_003136 [Dimargaris xerosporica]